jgi:hypothetical protein
MLITIARLLPFDPVTLSDLRDRVGVTSRTPSGLLPENLLHIPDFALHLSAYFFGRPSVTLVWISRRLADLFFRFACRFLERAFDFIACARFHKNEIAHYEGGGCIIHISVLTNLR